MNTCDAIQQRLAEAGLEGIQGDAEALSHLESCDDCTEVLARLSELDLAFSQLPQHDAPDALVDATLAAVRRAPRGSTMSNWATGNRRVLAGALAASVIFAAGLGVMQTIAPSQFAADEKPAYSRPYRAYQSSNLEMLRADRGSLDVGDLTNIEASDDPQVISETGQVAQQKLDTSEYRPQEQEEQLAFGQTFADGPEHREADDYYRKESRIIAQLEGRLSHGEREAELDEIGRDKDAEKTRSEDAVRGPLSKQPIVGGKAKGAGSYEAPEGSESLRLEDFALMSNERQAPQDLPTSRLRADEETGAGLGGEQVGDGRANLSDEKNRALKSQTSEKQNPEKQNKDLVRELSQLDPDDALVTSKSEAVPEAEPAAPAAPPAVDEDGRQRRSGRLGAERPRGLAKDFLAQLASRDGLAFQSATGYWANTYLPGDPAMRLLQARLQDWNRARLGRNVRLEQAVRPVAQPFDGPEDAALALYLHGDTKAIQGPTRLRLQVGIKGAERQGGRRPAMNVGVVVDLRDTLDQATMGRLRALILSLERARQPGDRFSLTVAGPGGGMLVIPEQFKHGPLRVAMDRLFDPSKGAETTAVDLLEAVGLATRNVRAGDDPNSVLGASLVLLATGSPIAQDLTSLEQIAHVNAVSGVPMSVVSLGGGTDPDHLDRLVAAGQGNRRILAAADEAEALIDRELHSASRAVARALRLRIRLAPGVQLVQVLGSRPLGDPQSQLVREAEQALDRRLARNLGIQADRGEDEEGIQIVIPSFYAGDAHVVLLDVVAERPGPVADVTLRYKDVVYLRNGVARAGLSIGSGQEVQGPLERNVLKNRVAWELARQTRQVSQYLAAGQVDQARALLALLGDLIQGLRLEVAGWSADPDLAADEAMLREYLAVLNSPAVGDGVQRRYLAESLRYVAYRKLQSAAR
jgi:hypothetical protein